MAKKKAVKQTRGNQMTAPQSSSQYTPTIEEFFKTGVEALKEVMGDEAPEYHDLGTKAMNRRIRSVRNHAERANREFGQKYQEIRSIEARLASFESAPRESFDSANYLNNVYLGAALWILDELKKTSRIHEIYRYLPKDFGLLMDARIPWYFHDVSYDEDLIRSVIIVLAARNGEDEHHNYERLLTERKSGKRSKLPTWREEYDAIIGLLDPAKVKQACENFREKQWDFLDRFFKGINYCSKRENRVLRERENIESQGVSPMFSGPLAVKPNAQTLLPGLGGFTGFDDERLKEWERIEIELMEAHHDTTGFEFAAVDYCHMSLEKVLEKEKSRQAAEAISSFQPGNPYEICFAFLYLLDLDDDDVWLHNTSLAVVNAAGDMLPWNVNEPESSEYDDSLDDMTFNGTHWLEGDNKDEIDLYNTWYKGADFGFDECDRINLAHLIYKLSKGVAPREMHPFQEARKKNAANDPNVDRAIDIAEILFLSVFESKSANYEVEMDWPGHAIDTIPEEEPVEEEAEATTTTVPLDGYWGSVAGQIGLGGIEKKVVKEVRQPSEETENEGDKEDLAEENRRLQIEIKKLKKALYDTGRSVKAEKKQLEQKRKTAEREHRELADLRELVFNQQEGKYENEEKTERISFPYSPIHRTVVFGGHDSWAREIKPRLPGVRFIDANAAPNADLIRNADVVWIQTNCIGHSDFYKIIDEVKKHNIPLRYFTFAGATKCAEQLALADQK